MLFVNGLEFSEEWLRNIFTTSELLNGAISIRGSSFGSTSLSLGKVFVLKRPIE